MVTMGGMIEKSNPSGDEKVFPEGVQCSFMLQLSAGNPPYGSFLDYALKRKLTGGNKKTCFSGDP